MATAMMRKVIKVNKDVSALANEIIDRLDREFGITLNPSFTANLAKRQQSASNQRISTPSRQL